MALSGGHWENLAAVEKLTQSTMIPGVTEEDVKRNNPLMWQTVFQANGTGQSIKWLREDTTAGVEDDVQTVGIGGQTAWTEGMDYVEKENVWTIKYVQRKLDKFIPAIYTTFNNYEKTKLQEILRGMGRKLGDSYIYDDYTYGGTPAEMDGLHAIAAEVTDNTANNLDMGETALSMKKWRDLFNAMKYGVDFWLIPFTLGVWFDAAYQEKGLAGLASATAGTMAFMSWGVNQAGEPMQYFCGKPVYRTDYLVAEQANTGQGSDARAKYSSGTAMYSIFGIRLGRLDLGSADPGIRMVYGMPDEVDASEGELIFLEYFNKLENYIGKGMRAASYVSTLPGSSMCVGRIYDITDAAVTV